MGLMPNLTGYYQARPQLGPSSSTPVYRPDGTLDEAAMRGGGLAPGNYQDAPINTAAPTHTNGNHFAGTNVPMSDQAYRLLTANGGQLATDRDVLGGGKFGIRGWMNDHPLGVMAAFIAAAAGGAALSPAAGGGGAASGAGTAAGSGATTGTGIAGFGGAGTGGTAANLGADLAGIQMGGGAAGSLAASGGIAGGAGAFGGGLGQLAMNYPGLIKQAGGALGLGGGGSSGGSAAPVAIPQIGMMGSSMQPQPVSQPRQAMPLNQTMTRARPYMRTPIQFRGTTVWL
jgi:hypothetical protein